MTPTVHLLDTLIAISCGAAGLLCGWFAYPSLADTPTTSGETSESDEAEAGTEESEPCASNEERIRKIAERLQSLTEGMVDQVDDHNSKVMELNATIRELDLADDPDGIYKAIAQLVDTNEKLSHELCQSHGRLQEQSQQLESAQHAAMSDKLTGLGNRRAFDLHMDTLMSAPERGTATLIIVDVDHFKHFNDVYGHLAGDHILTELGKILDEEFADALIVARFGGEEFAIILEGKTVKECGRAVDIIRAKIADKKFIYDDQYLHVTTSMGMTELAADDTEDSWLDRADDALYAAKDNDRNCLFADVKGKQICLTKRDNQGNPNKSKKQDENPYVDSLMKTLVPVEPRFTNLPRGLEGLPIGSGVVKEFSKLANAVHASNSAFFCGVVKLNQHDANHEDLQAICRGVRSAIRGVDRIGILDAQTLVLALPNIDQESALMRAERIRASVSFLSKENEGKKTVGVSMAGSEQTRVFSEMLATCIGMLNDPEANGANGLTVATV